MKRYYFDVGDVIEQTNCLTPRIWFIRYITVDFCYRLELLHGPWFIRRSRWVSSSAIERHFELSNI